jgi:hypothetical protein
VIGFDVLMFGAQMMLKVEMQLVGGNSCSIYTELWTSRYPENENFHGDVPTGSK